MAETLKVERPRDASLPANPEYGPPKKQKKKNLVFQSKYTLDLKGDIRHLYPSHPIDSESFISLQNENLEYFENRRKIHYEDCLKIRLTV